MINPNSLKFEYWLETPAEELKGKSKEEILGKAEGSLTIWIADTAWFDENQIPILQFYESLNRWVQQPNEGDFEFHILTPPDQTLFIKKRLGKVILSATYPISPLNSSFDKNIAWPILTEFLSEMKQGIREKYGIEA